MTEEETETTQCSAQFTTKFTTKLLLVAESN